VFFGNHLGRHRGFLVEDLIPNFFIFKPHALKEVFTGGVQDGFKSDGVGAHVTQPAEGFVDLPEGEDFVF
jgi:hypothetical protein